MGSPTGWVAAMTTPGWGWTPFPVKQPAKHLVGGDAVPKDLVDGEAAGLGAGEGGELTFHDSAASGVPSPRTTAASSAVDEG